MDKYVSGRVDVVMFNLGYLPGGDHDLATNPVLTMKAVDISLRLIKRGGIITIMSYSGHPAAWRREINWPSGSANWTRTNIRSYIILYQSNK